MAVTDTTALTQNRLLAALPDDARDRLAEALDLVDVELRQVLYEREKRIEHVYFPLTGVMSVVAETDAGQTVEVATVGSEGMVGLPVFLRSALTTAHTAFAQIPGQALRMSADDLARLVEQPGPLERALHRYTQALIAQIAQGAACNISHSIEQRAARWLIMTHDRVGSDSFQLTQEFFAQMLGANRTTVSAVQQRFSDDRLISYTRGNIVILERPRLEERACDCYRIITEEFARMLDDIS